MVLYTGTVKGNAIILDEIVQLPEGAKVEVMPVDASRSESQSLQEWLQSFAGVIDGLPDDMSENHDHYLYGTPKE